MVLEALDELVVGQARRVLGTRGLRRGAVVAHGGVVNRNRASSTTPGDYDRAMPQFQKGAEERIVSAEEYGRGYLERDGMVVRKRAYVLIRELEDGRYLVRVAPQPQQV